MTYQRTSFRWRQVAAAGTIAALALAVVACGDTPAEPVTAAAPQPAVSVSATPPPAGTATPTTPATPGSPRRTASAQLAGFLAAARTTDTRLHRAARLVNAGITPEAVTVRPETVAAVEAVDTAYVARQIPAGLDRELLRRALLVYSDLSSRRMAMSPITYAGHGVVVLPRPGSALTSPSAGEILDALGNGHAAAARFESDYAALRGLAASTPPFARHGDRSRAAAEVDVRVAYIDVANGGCAGTGGEVFTQLQPLQWRSGGGDRWTGTINGIAFQTVYRYGGWWRVSLAAC